MPDIDKSEPKGTEQMTSIMQQLHDSEINASIASFYDGVWTAKIGDDMNGFAAETTMCRTFDEAEAWLAAEAKRLYPQSLFATGKYPPGYLGIPGVGKSLDGEGEWTSSHD